MTDISDKVIQTGKAGERHNTAFVVGSVLGGVVGAATALWKAPQTGEEFRRKLTSGGNGEAQSGRATSSAGAGSSRVLETARRGSDRLLGFAKAGSARISRSDSGGSDASSSGATSPASFSNRVLSFVEKAAAPIVGVRLGQTANGSGPAAGGSSARITPIRPTEATTAEHPVTEDGLHGQDRLTFGTYSGRSNAAPSSGTASTISSGATVGQTETSGTPGGSNVGQTEIPGGTSIDQGEISAVATPSPASSDIPEGVPGHVPTTDELVTPAAPFVPQPNTAQQSPGTPNLFPEPDSDSTERP